MVPFDKNIPREPGIQYIVADVSALRARRTTCAHTQCHLTPDGACSRHLTDVATRLWSSVSAVWMIERRSRGRAQPRRPRLPPCLLPRLQGSQECLLCNMLVAESFLMGSRYPNLCGWQLRDSVNAPMCHAMQRVLQSCPEFVTDWCYQDSGPWCTARKRSPHTSACPCNAVARAVAR